MKNLWPVALSLLLFGCATIVRNDEQIVNIQSNVDDVKIEIMNSKGVIVWSGYAPTSVQLAAADYGYFNPETYTIRATKKGCGSGFAEIDWHVSMWYIFGNLFSWGIFGWLLVDPISGDLFYLDDTKVVYMGGCTNEPDREAKRDLGEPEVYRTQAKSAKVVSPEPEEPKTEETAPSEPANDWESVW